MEVEPPVTRRGVVSAFLIAAFGAIFGTLATAAARFLGGPPDSRHGARKLEAGPIDRFRDAAAPVETTIEWTQPDGYYTAFRRERIFVWSENGALVGLSSTCSHLGCAVSWDPARDRFRCPCHGGLYRRDGSVAGGPPPRPLARLPLEIRDGRVWVAHEEKA
jgi:Rieske Fe-S protein